jgi:hypothetical protein
MFTLEVRRRPGTGAEMHRITGPSATVGASSGNEVVVRARGVYGRHLRLLERDGAYHLDLFRGIAAVQLNGREFSGGAIAPGDRITIGEATITVVDAAPAMHPTPVGEMPEGDIAAPALAPSAPQLPATEVEYRGLRLAAYRLCRQARTSEDLATELTDFLDRELPPSEWAVGEFAGVAGFRPLASTFRENPALPPRMVQDIRSGERLARSGIVFARLGAELEAGEPAARQTQEVPVGPAAQPVEASPAEIVLRSTDDLKKIVETVEREVIDRAMRRVEGNQSRGAQILNISRGSLIAKLKEFAVPDYRYLRREKGRRG